jgi:hypothetical protein
MPHKSRRKNKQPSHLKVVRSLPLQAPASVPAAGPLDSAPRPVIAAALKLPALKTARGAAAVVWPTHVGSEIRRIAIIGGAILAVIVLVSLLF